MVAPIIFIVWIAKVTQGSRKSLNSGRAALGRELEDTSVDAGVYDMVGNPIPDCICFTYFSITFRSTRSVFFWHQTPCFTAVHVLTLTVYISRCKVESTFSCHLHVGRPQVQCSGIQINIQLYHSNITDIRNKFPYEYLIFSCTYSITIHLYFYPC